MTEYTEDQMEELKDISFLRGTDRTAKISKFCFNNDKTGEEVCAIVDQFGSGVITKPVHEPKIIIPFEQFHHMELAEGQFVIYLKKV